MTASTVLMRTLFLKNLKSKSSRGLYGIREKIARPLDPIAIEMLRQVERIQKVLLKFGYIKEHVQLLTPVSVLHPTKLTTLGSKSVYNSTLDIFCDYFETPLFKNKRYYIRQHQLRRFFAMLFFWGSGFGGLETLRWFLGHTDVEHIYNYISESTPGAVLKSVKVQYVTENIESISDLGELIQDKYGSKDYTLLETEELEEYIEALMDDGDVDIEPVFFEDDTGKSYKIIVKIRGS